ncbi:hypothetical protein G6F66_015507 [Rhizopus arrhizus]|nr:hypothetical protein G6F66_015507 [Rhizopus arrhizus]
MATPIQTAPAKISSSITAALPRSLARPSSGWRSTDSASASASMAEFNNSAASTMITVPTRKKTSTVVRPRKNAAGIISTASACSWRNAASYLTAAFKPCQE